MSPFFHGLSRYSSFEGTIGFAALSLQLSCFERTFGVKNIENPNVFSGFQCFGVKEAGQSHAHG
jgi:hypothetical protein